MLQLWAWSLVGGVQEATHQCVSLDVSISVPLPSSISKIKTYFLKNCLHQSCHWWHLLGQNQNSSSRNTTHLGSGVAGAWAIGSALLSQVLDSTQQHVPNGSVTYPGGLKTIHSLQNARIHICIWKNVSCL
ncbi:unnamed protein product [Pipistrellus nathusii]|uniref:Uncharacterized protein n=1 Tax=Pipistrellus nathusii TaxID=59473 RepID=A0ABP0ALV4_PIPNA